MHTRARRLAAASFLLAIHLVAGCNRGSDDAAPAATAAPAPKAEPRGFPIDPSLPPSCRSNVEWLAACGRRVPGADGADLLSRARTMQTSYLEMVKKEGAARAEARCKDLASIVRSNRRCQ